MDADQIIALSDYIYPQLAVKADNADEALAKAVRITDGMGLTSPEVVGQDVPKEGFWLVKFKREGWTG